CFWFREYRTASSSLLPFSGCRVFSHAKYSSRRGNSLFWRYSLRYSGLYWAHFRSSANSLLQYRYPTAALLVFTVAPSGMASRHFRLAWLQQPQRVTFCTWLYPAYPSVTRQPVKPLRKASARLPLRSSWYSKSRIWCSRSAALAYSHIL